MIFKRIIVMKKIVVAVLAIIGITSCTIKEEFTINEDGKIKYAYNVNGAELQTYIPDQEDFFSTLDEQKDFVKSMEKGMTLEKFFTEIKSNDDLLKGHNDEANKFLTNNKTTYEKVKNHIIKVDFKTLNYTTELASTSENMASESKLLNDFLFDFFNAIDNPFNSKYINNQKVITKNKVEIKLDKTDYENLINGLSEQFGGESTYSNLFKYKLIIHTPRKITASSENGSNFSLDQKTVEFNYTFSEIIADKSKIINVTY